MGTFGTNDTKVRGIACEFPRKVTQKQAMWCSDRSWWQVMSESVLQGVGNSRSGHMWTGDRRQWRSGWPYGLFLTFVQERRVMREGGENMGVILESGRSG